MTIENIIEKELNILKYRLKIQNLDFYYTKDVIKFIFDLNVEKNSGARSIKNIITKNIETLISNNILNKNITKNSKFTLFIDNSKLKIQTNKKL